MGSEQNEQFEKEKTPFASRFNMLCEESNESLGKIGAAIGKTRQCVSQYRYGKAIPDATTLLLISKHFGVSIDWLLKADDDAPQKIEANKGAAMKYTGLSERAIDYLAGEGQTMIVPINDLFSSPFAQGFFVCLARFLDTYANPYTELYIEHEDGAKTLIFDAAKMQTCGLTIDKDVIRQTAITRMQEILKMIGEGLDRAYFVGEKSISAKAYYGNMIPDKTFVTTKDQDKVLTTKDREDIGDLS